MSKSNQSAPSFTIRLVGDGVTPATVPVRTLSNAASAVMRLAIGSEKEENQQVHVLDVRSGSATYPCLIDAAETVENNLGIVGEVTREPESDHLTLEMLPPIRTLSKIASKLQGRVEVYLGKKRGKPAAVFSGDTYKRIQGTSIIYDETTVTGVLMRVGGVEEKRCSIRVPTRDSLLYCTLDEEDLSRKLGQHLYERVTLHGRGRFFARTWQLISLRVTGASFHSQLTTEQLLRNLRESGTRGWDSVIDVDAEIRAMR